MKCSIPEISWHNRDPVFSVDFQPKLEGSDSFLRLASGGSDSHVLIWHISYEEGGAVQLDLAADLTRHQRAVNCVRWSPSGELLASCDDESVIFIWRKKPESEAGDLFDDATDGDKEVWNTLKILRGHMEDVYDLSWSSDSQFLISGSVDNTAMVWDVQKGKSTAIIREHKGFVQGVAWDPLNKFLATFSTDRHLRFFDAQSKKNIARINKSTLPVGKDHALHEKTIRLFHDDTLQTFFRRLSFSPDGSIIVVPAGVAEEEGSSGKSINTTYIYSRFSLKEPIAVLPSPDYYTVAARFCPLLFELRDSKSPPMIPLPYRMIYAVATKCSVYLYDTQQKIPFGLISNIHYTRLTDLTWSHDGLILMVSSTDGYCSIVQFAEGELGKIYKETTIQDIVMTKMARDEPKKKKKTKKQKKEDGKKSPLEADSKENVDQLEVDEPMDISLTNLPESIKEKIPVDKIIKSNEIFSPQKQMGSPATPIQVRKFPRNLEESTPTSSDGEKKVTPPRNDDLKPIDVTTPKGSSITIHHNSHKTPTPIETRRVPRVLQPPTNVTKIPEGDEWPKPVTESPMDRKIPSADQTTPKTPRRIELTTLSTPKSKKKLL